MKNNGQEKRLWTAQFLLALILEICTSMVIYMVMPIVTTYATSLGASLTMAGLISGAFSLAAMCIRPFTGFLSDRIERRHVLALSNLVIGFACFGYFVTQNPVVFLFLRILHGVGFAISGTAIVSTLLDSVPGGQIGLAIGLHGLVNSLASAFGPSLSMALGQYFGFGIPMMAASILCMVVVALCFGLRSKRVHPQSTPKEASRLKLSSFIAPELWLLVLVGMSATLAQTAVTNFLLPLGVERAIEISMYFTVYAAVIFVLRPACGKLSDRYPLQWFVIPGLLFLGGGLLLVAFAQAQWQILLAAVLIALGTGSVSPAIQAGCVMRLDSARKGVATSTYYVGVDLGQGLSPVLVGAIASFGGYALAFQCCAGILAAILLLYFVCGQRKKRGEADGIL